MPPKKRGRPAKGKKEDDHKPIIVSDGVEEQSTQTKTRGRAAEAKIANAVSADIIEAEEKPTASKKRDCPTDVAKTDGAATNEGEVEIEPAPKKKRGRPAKLAKIDPAPISDLEVKDEEDKDEQMDLLPPSPEGKGDDCLSSPNKKRNHDAQVARTKDLVIPIDETCPLQPLTHHVYVDQDGIIYDASLNQTNVGGNNNKFYRIQILESKSGLKFQCWTRWGRVGERGQHKLLSGSSFDSAFREFSKKFKDKTGHSWDDRHQPARKGKYTFVERSYEPDSSSDDEERPDEAGARQEIEQSIACDVVESQLALPVQRLMQLIFNAEYFKEVMAEMNYDVDKLPLGKLSKRTIEQGYEALKALAAVILDPQNVDRNEYIIEHSNRYYSQIPHDFGRDRPTPIRTENMLKREIELLDSLSDMKIAEDIIKEAKATSGYDDHVHPIDRQFAGLGMSEMTPLSRNSKEFQELEAYLQGTRGATHSLGYELEDIFRIERNGEYDRFDESAFGKMKADRRLLWHGSRSTNFGGILSQGLRIAPPEAPASGYMFGKGVYLADMSSKSANYCAHGTSGNTGLLLLCEAELGKPMLELTNADYDAGSRAQAQGSWSTWGKGMIAPQKWKDASEVHESLKGVQMPDVSVKPDQSGVMAAYLQYNEYIAYDVSQIRLRYLFRVKMGYRY